MSNTISPVVQVAEQAADNAAREGLEAVASAVSVAPSSPAQEAANIVITIAQGEFPYIQEVINTAIEWGYDELVPVWTKIKNEAEKIWGDIEGELKKL